MIQIIGLVVIVYSSIVYLNKRDITFATKGEGRFYHLAYATDLDALHV